MSLFTDPSERELLAAAKANCVDAEPSTDLATMISTYSDERLQALSLAIDINYCRPEHDSLVSGVVDWVSQDANKYSFAVTVLAGLSSPGLELAREAVYQGGFASFDVRDLYKVGWLAYAPLIGFACFYDERLDRFTFALPDPVAQALVDGTTQTNATFAEILSDGFVDRTAKILERYGFLDPMELAELYTAACGRDLDENLLGAYYLVATWMPGSELWGHGFKDEYDAQICDEFRTLLDMGEVELVEAEMERIDKERRNMDPAPVGDLFDSVYETFSEWYEAQPEQAAFKVWLDAHVPRGEDGRFYASEVLDGVFECAQMPVGPDFLRPVFERYGGAYRGVEQETFMVRVCRCVNETPCWGLYGYTPAQLNPGMKPPALPI